MILAKKLELVWSYIVDFENELNPFEQRKIDIRQRRSHATVDTDETYEILERPKHWFK